MRVAVSGVNPHDTKKRAGWLSRALPAAGHPAFGRRRHHRRSRAWRPERPIGERVWFFRADAPDPEPAPPLITPSSPRITPCPCRTISDSRRAPASASRR